MKAKPKVEKKVKKQMKKEVKVKKKIKKKRKELKLVKMKNKRKNVKMAIKLVSKALGAVEAEADKQLNKDLKGLVYEHFHGIVREEHLSTSNVLTLPRVSSEVANAVAVKMTYEVVKQLTMSTSGGPSGMTSLATT
ncbi:hypothetical protein Sjap_002447 [Stephania japonica]|uniref:Uncharacterized protein n=1 Tax=Stephania japonica TaxID=461633 RepID=A0AAP0KP32_9MAGN